MSYNKIYKALCDSGAINHGSPLALRVLIELKRFCELNVVIPKGENRHPYADVLHEAVEGASIQQLQCNEWCNVAVQDGINPLSKYRIKPSEPVYEWQWLMIPIFGGVNTLTPFMSDLEYSNSPISRGHNYIKLEETKRERKQ